MVLGLENIDWFDPGIWLVIAGFIVVLTFIAIFFKIFGGTKEP